MSCTYRHNIYRGGNHDPIYLFFAEVARGLIASSVSKETEHISLYLRRESSIFSCVEC